MIPPRLTSADLRLLRRLADRAGPTPVAFDEPSVRMLLEARMIRTLPLETDCYAVPSGLGLRSLRRAVFEPSSI